MPPFYLHCGHNGVLAEDPDGSDLPDIEAARQEALAAARDLWAMAIVKGIDLSDDHFVVADDKGEHVLDLPFTEALPNGLKDRLRRS
jgi:hypothetical protein